MKPLKLICLSFILLAFFSLIMFLPRTTLAQECSSETPAFAPNLYQVNYSSTSATVYFAQPNTDFTGYVVSYGLTEGADAYSASFNMGKSDGAVTYTVSDLFPKTNYYFKVRAFNNCAYGPWSQTLKTNVAGGSSLPETGPINILSVGLGGFVIAILGMGLLLLL
jgi:hypothetical protein